MSCMPKSASSRADICRICSLLFISFSSGTRRVLLWSRERAAWGALDAVRYRDGAYPALDLRADQVDMQEPIIQPGAAHLDAFGQDEGALELTRGDAAMQIDALSIICLLAADDELVVLDRDAEIAHGEAGYRQGDPQSVLAQLLDIVGRISVARNFADPVEGTFEVVDPQE